MFKVIVAGGRDFSDYDLLCTKLHHLLSNRNDIEIVSGMARGADSLALWYAEENHIRMKKFPANWDRDGKSAGYKRNVVMAK